MGLDIFLQLNLEKQMQIFLHLRSELQVMRGFQKGVTLGGRTLGSVHNMGLQNRVANKFANFLHLSWDLYGVS